MDLFVLNFINLAGIILQPIYTPFTTGLLLVYASSIKDLIFAIKISKLYIFLSIVSYEIMYKCFYKTPNYLIHKFHFFFINLKYIEKKVNFNMGGKSFQNVILTNIINIIYNAWIKR